MRAERFKKIRESLSLSREQLGDLLGRSGTAIWRWETEKSPIPYHEAMMMRSFSIAVENRHEIGQMIVRELLDSGRSKALYLLLKAAHESENSAP